MWSPTKLLQLPQQSIPAVEAHMHRIIRISKLSFSFVGVFLVFFKHRKMSKIISTVCQFQQTKSMTKISAKIMTFWNFFNIPKPGVAFRVLLVVTSHYQSQCKKCVSFIFSWNPSVSLNIPDPSAGNLRERKEKAICKSLYSTDFVCLYRTDSII